MVGLDIHWFQKKSPKKDFWQSFVVWNRTRDSTHAQKMWRWPTEPLANEEANGKLRRTRAMP